MFLSSKQFKFWAWDPEEERRRQEKWQQEQERLLQVGWLSLLPFFSADALLIPVMLNRFLAQETHEIEFFSEVNEAVSSFCVHVTSCLCLIPPARGCNDRNTRKKHFT